MNNGSGCLRLDDCAERWITLGTATHRTSKLAIPYDIRHRDRPFVDLLFSRLIRRAGIQGCACRQTQRSARDPFGGPILGETLTVRKIAGGLLIAAGAIVLALS
jgi:hypothetical protein